MEPVHDKQWCDTQVQPILREAKRREKYPPGLDSIGVGNQNARWIVKEYGRLHREGIDAVMDEFLDLLQKDIKSFGFNSDVEIREAVYSAAGKLYTEARGHIAGAMMKRRLDPSLYEDLRTEAFHELEKGREDLNEHIETRITRPDLLGPVPAVTNINVAGGSTVGVINTGNAGTINAAVVAKKEASEGGL